MLHLFVKGGPVMWPLLLTSMMVLTVVLERIWFLVAENRSQDSALVGKILSLLENGENSSAAELGKDSTNPLVRTLHAGLSGTDQAFSQSLLRQASKELARYRRGLTVLDTAITLSPLLGLLGTVTGMIGAFSLLGDSQLGAPTAITGGIAEALIATCFGLGIAIVALLPFNFLNSRAEQLREELEDTATQAEILFQARGK